MQALRILKYWSLPFIILIISLGSTLLLWDETAKEIDSNHYLQFSRQVDDIVSETSGRLKDYTDLIRSLRSLFASKEFVTRKEFADFVLNMEMDKYFPGMVAVNFARYIRHPEKKDFENRVRNDRSAYANDFSDFRIRPEGDRPEYMPIELIEPWGGGINPPLVLIPSPIPSENYL